MTDQCDIKKLEKVWRLAKKLFSKVRIIVPRRDLRLDLVYDLVNQTVGVHMYYVGTTALLLRNGIDHLVKFPHEKKRSEIKFLLVTVSLLEVYDLTKSVSAEVVIRIPAERVRDQDGYYRLDYWPPQGNPLPNSTFTPTQVSEGIQLTRALPGTKYDFQLYYTNATINDYPTWTASITTVPSPPSNLSIQVRGGKNALVSWDPPVIGGYSGFKLKVIPLSEPQNSNRNVGISEAQLPFNLRELTPGASYELQLYTVYEYKESAAYISSNFTTRKSSTSSLLSFML
nr:tyrosine-protein phosphatase 10D-like [Cherax quadricarinatus]